MSAEIDFLDQTTIEEFADLVEGKLDRRPKVSSLWLLIGVWVVDGLLLTLALRTGESWLYVLGLAVAVLWVAGFAVAKGEARWFRW